MMPRRQAFKAGVYDHGTTSSSKDGGKVHLHQLSTSHSSGDFSQIQSFHNITVPSNSGKKGAGINHNPNPQKRLDAINANWWYNWGPMTQGVSGTNFVPMIFSGREISSSVDGDGSHVLGFNEPDNDHQSHMDVDTAVGLWPQVASKASKAVSPAVASDYVWLSGFLQKASPHPNFVAVHHYGCGTPCTAESLKNRLEDIHSSTGKEVWVTEWAAQTHGDAASDPGRYTSSEVISFMREAASWMDSQEWVLRYAWHDSATGSSALWHNDGSLTETGEAYAAL